ncbi:hypothetical protein MUN78_10255 [Leucobacter allii]|uniref:Transposase n=1 Tax=Leucobacter allii TaxID=2932247 RepID=A0ABY4FJ11_9MICO|nr:hypothetical protein [Leucobacter allii]UOQ56086.1 hypothetical protein MUN78_10255 [Leucobacter allii]
MSTYIEDTPENNALMLAILGPIRRDHKTTVVKDGGARRINGRYIVGNVPVLDEDGEIAVDWDADEIVTRRQRFRIPKGHPWRGTRP